MCNMKEICRSLVLPSPSDSASIGHSDAVYACLKLCDSCKRNSPGQPASSSELMGREVLIIRPFGSEN